ncbi:hypothetical protein [Mesorhizobium sp. INR15]|uniref:hypothetical protein n=1 Tax=Mesorhizobium sp. INR15 TaxID=2654248 RepID=UPI0018966320|nr:hypothetical protein [Mesorhizobium sp. INR15]
MTAKPASHRRQGQHFAKTNNPVAAAASPAPFQLAIYWSSPENPGHFDGVQVIVPYLFQNASRNCNLVNSMAGF